MNALFFFCQVDDTEVPEETVRNILKEEIFFCKGNENI